MNQMIALIITVFVCLLWLLCILFSFGFIFSNFHYNPYDCTYNCQLYCNIGFPGSWFLFDWSFLFYRYGSSRPIVVPISNFDDFRYFSKMTSDNSFNNENIFTIYFQSLNLKFMWSLNNSNLLMQISCHYVSLSFIIILNEYYNYLPLTFYWFFGYFNQ